MTATLYPTHRITTATSAAPNYVLRRTVAALVAATVLAVAIIAVSVLLDAAVDFGGRPAAASEIGPSGSEVLAAPIVRFHVAEPGDTLWSIAAAFRGDVGRDAFIDALIDLNGGTSIQAGQAIRLP
ncbi:MAG: LysM domain-containing protein [Ilumatobacteraceae bacterium]